MRVRRSLSTKAHKQSQPDQPERQRRRYKKKGKTDLSESGLRCTRCDCRNIVFLRGEGKVYCNPCKLRFPPPNCDACQNPETKPHHAKERRWRCLTCRKTFTVAGAGSPGKRRCGRKRKLHSEEEDDDEFDCASFIEPSIATNRPKRALQIRQVNAEESEEEEKDLSSDSMDDSEMSEASEAESVAEHELLSSQESAVNASIDSFFDPASISDMQKIAARLAVMMAVYGRPTSFSPLLKELDELAFAFDRSKLALCTVDNSDLDPLESMAYASTLVSFKQTTYEVVSTLLEYTMIPYYREERDVMRLIMQFLIGVANMRLIEFSLAPYMAKHICTLAHVIDRYCNGTHDSYILDVGLIMFRLAAIYLASPLGSRTKLNLDDCGKVFTTIVRCLGAMTHRPLSQKPVWDILHTLKQHPIFSAFVMTAVNSSRLRNVIKETQQASSAGGEAVMSSVRNSIELCVSAYLPSNCAPDAPELPARVTDCRRDEATAPSQAVF